ncbi:hypothetical protein C2S52_021171 [Perilla frutescens var. hirtella]|nr:hypothetical protein C2S52_021171 [Perilla frutescens var. hirtella]
MALEAVIYQQDPFIYGCKDNNYNFGLEENLDISGCRESSVALNTTSSPETFGRGAASHRKRRRAKTLKNKEEMENQRMTHIAVERNRRRQMNDYLSLLRSLMPPSYAQRGDQASIVGGAINYVKELEQLVQFLEAYKSRARQKQTILSTNSNIFSNFFTFPQYTMRRSSTKSSPIPMDVEMERRSSIAEIEVTMVESHANIKILISKTRPKQLLKMVAGFHSICLNVLHLNITTVHQSVLYSFSVKVEEGCELRTVNEIASAVHDMVGTIQQEST